METSVADSLFPFQCLDFTLKSSHNPPEIFSEAGVYFKITSDVKAINGSVNHMYTSLELICRYLNQHELAGLHHQPAVGKEPQGGGHRRH